MEAQGWKALNSSSPRGSPAKSQGKGGSSSSANPFAGPSSTDYAVQSTYVPPQQQHDADPSDPFAHLNMGGTSLPAPSHPQAPAASSYAQPAAVQQAQHAQPGQLQPPAAAAPSYVPEVVPAVPSGGAWPGPGAGAAGSTSRAGSQPLQFQDHNLPSYNVAGKMGPQEVPKVQSYSQSTNLLGGAPPSASLGGGDGSDNTNGGRYSVFNLKKYRRYFNVDTDEVLVRMRDSVIGAFKPNFLEKVSDNVDLYGPFWIATTLVFLSAVAGNYASYVSYKRAQSQGQATGSGGQTWFYDIDKVGYSAVLFYGYVGVVGMALWAALKWWFRSDVALAQVWCTYGYALSLYIPVSIVCILPFELLRWILIGVATLTSGLFLLLNFRRPIFDVAGAKATPVWVGLGCLHLALGLALKLYFFQYWS